MNEETLRKVGKETLIRFFEESIASSIEINIYNYCRTNNYDLSMFYMYAVYNVILNNKESVELNRDFLWNSKSFDELRQMEEEQDKFIIQPFEIVEGITECKCGSKKVFSYSKQTRGGDEATSTFNECAKCKAKWMYNG
jgi:DNA-directed RNA polymerase subunit M/transcription elongation factor TFIIS